MTRVTVVLQLRLKVERAVPLVSVVGEGFFGISVGLPSRPELLHSFFSAAVVDEFSIMFCSLCHNLERQHTC